MQHVFAFLPDCKINRSFERYFKFANRAELHVYQISNSVNHDSDNNALWISDTFASISAWLNKNFHEHNLSSGVGILEYYDEKLLDLSHLNPLHTRQTWGALAAMLILAFPEIYWIHITPHPFQQNESNSFENDRFNQYHRLGICDKEKRLNLSKTFQTGGKNIPQLFDPFGIRSMIRENICKTDTTKGVDYIPRRKEAVVSIDEEEDYACFVSYIAYRFGYTAVQINTFLALKELRKISPEKFDISFEDMSLNFPDRPAAIDTLSDLEIRHEKFLAKDKIKKLIIVTSGRRESLDSATIEKNEQLKKALNSPDDINKPFSGIFKFWEEAQQFEDEKPKLAAKYKDTIENMRHNNRPADKRQPIGHSAPGRLLIIANSLIKRAELISASRSNIKDAILGATLTLEAVEYLGYRTPTVTLHALALKNKFEVLAESMFYGVGYSISQKPRFEEIREELKFIGKWYKENSSAVLNAEIKLINNMAIVYQEQGLFDEESECMEQIRALYQQLSQKRNESVEFPKSSAPTNKILNKLELVLMTYINFLLKSIWNFIFAVVLWIWGFGVIFAVININLRAEPSAITVNSFVNNLAHGLYDSCVAFFSMQPAHDISGNETEKSILVLSVLCLIISYCHLGIFISYAYSLVTRKQ